MSQYEIPNLDKPVTEEEFLRLKKYMLNSSLFVLDNFFYSKQGVVDFLTIRKNIPAEVIVANKEKEETHHIIREVFEELETNGAFKEKEHAEAKAESLIFKGKGLNYVEQHLESKKFPRAIIRDVIEEVKEKHHSIIDEKIYDNARKVVNSRMFAKKSNYEKENYFISALVRKGFSVDSIHEVMRSNEYKEYFKN